VIGCRDHQISTFKVQIHSTQTEVDVVIWI